MSKKEARENCSGAYPALWRIRYEWSQRIVRSVAYTGEVETIGYRPATSDYDVVSLTPEMAMLTFTENCPVHAPSDKLFKVLGPPEFICYVDAMTITRTGYIGL